MKNFTLRLMMLSLLAFLAMQAKAQVSDAATYFAKLITAQKYMEGDGLPRDTAKAFRLYKDCAENGNMTDAMAQLGAMYRFGYGTPKELSKAFLWLSKSAERGNPYGMYYLGAMYKMGETVPRDFGKAYGYFKASAEKGLPNGMYGAGYCAYKGLGTKQDYAGAAGWFSKGVEKNNAACSFMLGICYRNGFGVEQNEQEAIKLLQKASEKKLGLAAKELEKQFPEIAGRKPIKENSGDTGGNGNGNGHSKKEKFKKLLTHQAQVSLDGTWTGARYLYDWSGQHILSQSNLLVTLEQTGNHLKGEWIENGELVVKFDGIVVDGQIVFNGSKFTGKGRYGEKFQMEFRFARFEAVNADVNYLAGNIESYSPLTKEPGRPCYVVMSKLQKKSISIDTLQAMGTAPAEIAVDSPIKSDTKGPETKEKATVSTKPAIVPEDTGTKQSDALTYFKEKEAMLAVFPNPFKNEINISYRVNDESDTRLYIYNATGNMVLQKPLGIKQPGNHLEKVQLETVPGQYIVRLVIGNEAYAKIIIKQ